MFRLGEHTLEMQKNKTRLSSNSRVALLQEEASRFCSPPPVAGSALARGDQTIIRQANHPSGIGERDCGIGELLPELGLVLRA
jgi:hypothetical protein